MLIKFWAPCKQSLPACCQTLGFFLWCAHLRLWDFNPGHHFWETSIQTCRIHFGEFPLSTWFYHIWQKAWFDSPPFLELDLELIKEWQKMWASSPVKRDLKYFWICICIVIAFPHPHLFCRSRCSFFSFFSPRRGIFKLLKRSLASHLI